MSLGEGNLVYFNWKDLCDPKRKKQKHTTDLH